MAAAMSDKVYFECGERPEDGEYRIFNSGKAISCPYGVG